MKVIYSIFLITLLVAFNCVLAVVENRQNNIEMTSVNTRSIEYIVLQSEWESKQITVFYAENSYSGAIHNTEFRALDIPKHG